MISILTERKQVSEAICQFTTSRKVLKELGEPIIFDDGDRFFIKQIQGQTVAFAALSGKGFLKYVYVKTSNRGQGLFLELYKSVEEMAKALEIKEITAVSTLQGLPLYQKNGFEITKSFTNYHKIKKTI